jgi:hypothetical protein
MTTTSSKPAPDKHLPEASAKKESDGVFALRRGLSLLPSRDGTYRIVRGGESVHITSAFARSAVLALAGGKNPFFGVPSSQRHIVDEVIRSLSRVGFITSGRSEIALPPRYLNEIVERDLAAQQLRARCEPELLQSQWSDAALHFGEDQGAEILAARTQFQVFISGRNRIATLLHSLLLASGVTQVQCVDRFNQALIRDSDIGSATITGADLAQNFYDHLQSHRRTLSLFPIDRRPSGKQAREVDTDDCQSLVVHSGAVDIEDMVDWLTLGRPHLIIHPAVADEITIGPLVIPGLTPCQRCADLNQMERLGYCATNRISLTENPEVAMVGAHFIAALVASQVLHFIDSAHTSGVRFTASAASPTSAIARTTRVNLQNLSHQNFDSITAHPLCGCGTFRKDSPR